MVNLPLCSVNEGLVNYENCTTKIANTILHITVMKHSKRYLVLKISAA